MAARKRQKDQRKSLCTNEDKGEVMCDCLKTVLKNAEEKLKPKKEVLDWKIDWKDSVFRFDGGCGVGLRIAYEYRLLKKDGTPMKNLKKDDVFVAMSFCPFCGDSLKVEKNV